MKYAVMMNSGAMIYLPIFIKIGFAIQNLIGGYTDTDTHMPTFIFLTKKVG